MRLLTITLLTFVSFNCFAQVPSFWPKQSSIEEIQAAMTAYGSVRINVRYMLGDAAYTVYPHHIQCEAGSMERKMKIRTNDGTKHVIGYYCDLIPNA